MNALKRLGSLYLILAVLLAPMEKAKAQASGELQYFPETGHNVMGEFLRFYRSTARPELVYGYPITEQFTSVDGKFVQYFQRARFELGAGLPGKRPVLLTPLGQATYEAGSPRLDIYNPAACRSFQTGFQVCFAFLDYYDANGGPAKFGDPISPFEFHENLIVQYFDKARFEWRADRPEGQRVVLTDLGRLYFDQIGEDPSALIPLRPVDATISPILSIHARAFVSDPITQSSGRQTVHMIVRSQTDQPVSNANGKATIYFPDQTAVDYFFTTDPAGLGGITFNFEGQKIGKLVPIEIIVTFQGMFTRTSTSFRIWY